MVRKKANPWIWGCGIGCGLVLLVVVGLFTAGSIFIGRTVSGFDRAAETRDRLDERFGPPAEFTPPPAGSLPAGRLEAFLAVREAIADEQRAIASIFERLPMSRRAAEELEARPLPEKIVQVLGIARSAMGLGIETGDFFRARNEAMLESGIGMGEYTWIYAVAYWSWLGHSPDDGPVFEDERDAGEADGVRLTGPGVRHRIRDELLAMMENQVAALPPHASADWRAALESEVEAMRGDPHRFPWQEGMPTVLVESLEPHRARFEATYSHVTGALELARNRRRGRWSFTAD